MQLHKKLQFVLLAASIALVAAACNTRKPEGLPVVDTRGPVIQTPVDPTPTLPSTTKPTLNPPKDPYQTPPYVPDYRQPGPPPEAPQNEVPASAPAQYVSYKGQDGKNALDLLKASHKVEVKVYSGIGEFVDAIDGLKSDTKHFWSFYVNGKQSTVGAGSYTTKTTDTIEWKFEQIK